MPPLPVLVIEVVETRRDAVGLFVVGLRDGFALDGQLHKGQEEGSQEEEAAEGQEVDLHGWLCVRVACGRVGVARGGRRGGISEEQTLGGRDG